ncbi:BamA/TamA family outer membrane protein [Sphingobacterium sp. lm-10]|uniref:translocation and assembly module lipoprotein TamL n=1 Tax=Sphingobacterium sp. lm-10 TaxID=2944904 RepID=UPI00202048BE|nr:BamA/TamA family outer membrane protein [Sphingobacterium sp. lm-10]MCL7989246.1 BamA/TamA family outer membrane protein [Sphingobacterium sp. lm-10]
MIRYQTYILGAIITLFAIISTSCRSAKYLDDGQALVKDVDIVGVPSGLRESASLYVSNDIRPNSRLYLQIYNLFNTKNGRYKTEGIKNVGEPPRILDSAMVDLSANQIQRFLNTNGYFDAEVTPDIEIRKKKAYIDFRADMGTRYHISEIDRSFSDEKIENIYQTEILPRTQVRIGGPYMERHLFDERERMYVAMKNQGYYEYLRQYMRVGVDTIGRQNQTKLLIDFTNPDSARHQIFHINNVFVRIRQPDGLPEVQTESKLDTSRRIQFEDETGKFRLRPLARYVFLRKGMAYSLNREELSYNRLFETNGFRSVKINYEKIDSTLLDVHYELTPRPAMSNQIEGEFVFSSGMSGFNVANTYSHRNIFGGAELLEIRTRYGILFDPRLPGSITDKIFNNDFQIGASIVFPRILTPFRVRSVGSYGLPRTTISSSLQLFFQDNTYSNRYLINTLNYSWHQAENILHSYTPIVLEYREGRLNETFSQRLRDQGFQLYVETNDRQYFGLGSQYAITYNGNKLNRVENFSFLRGMVDVSGNTLGLLSNLFNFNTDEQGQRLVFNVPYLQYIKGEVDYRLYRHLGGNRQFVFRLNGGVAVPYGNNSTLLIFEKSFFAGGMNGIRAWQARTLGPGNYSREGLTEDLRVNLRNLDQLGEVKLETNAEFRFRILNKFLGARLNGATFLDAGNVWRLRELTPNLNPGGEIRFDRFFQQIALGTGFGLRFDMNYFTIRLDAGMKVKDPQFSGSDQWVIQHLFNSREFRAAYFERHRPDRYSFIQYNFGVGMPF